MTALLSRSRLRQQRRSYPGFATPQPSPDVSRSVRRQARLGLGDVPFAESLPALLFKSFPQRLRKILNAPQAQSKDQYVSRPESDNSRNDL